MKNIYLFIAVFVALNVHAQKFELGKVTIKELEEKRHPTDSSAEASVLYNKARSYYSYSNNNGFSVIHNFEIRIKIYKKEGLHYANYEIPFRIGYENLNSDVVSVTDAATYNLVNGKIEKTKLTGDGTFKEKKSDKWRTISIALPDVKVGSVIEFKYSLKTENLLWFPKFIFQKEIPVNFAEYKTEVPVAPVGFIYKPIVKGFLKVETKNNVENATQTFTGDNAMRTESFTYQQLVSVHSFKNIPALREEPFVDNLENYSSSIDYELELIRKPDVPDKNFSQNWEGVAKTIYEDADFGKQIKIRDYFASELNQVLQGTTTREEKMKAIFNHVKTRMNWNGKYGIFTEKGVKTAYFERTGNVAEINFILIGMLNAAGFLSNPVLLSTINNGIATYPNQTAFNYVIVATELDGKQVLLDAANKFTTNNILPKFTLNWTGRLIDQFGGSQEIDLSPAVTSKNVVNLVTSLSVDGKISGKARVQKTDYEGFEWREDFSGMNRDGYLEKLENSLKNSEVKNYTVENEKSPESPIVENFEFSSNNLVDGIGGKLYFSPLLFFTQSKNPFVQEERKLPIYFGFPKQDRYNITIEIPEGYAVESLPAAINIATGESVASFKLNLQQTDRKIQIAATFEISKMLVSQEFYPILKDFFQKMTDKQNEKIVLKKI